MSQPTLRLSGALVASLSLLPVLALAGCLDPARPDANDGPPKRGHGFGRVKPTAPVEDTAPPQDTGVGDTDVPADTDSGTDPGTDSGTDPGTDSGTDPGTDSGTDPSSGDPRITWVERGTELPDLSGYPSPLDETFDLDFGFGPRTLSPSMRQDFHGGADWDAPEGEPIYAIADGYIEKLDAGGATDGNSLYIRHDLDWSFDFHGEEIDRFYVLLSHLSAFAVEQGDSVTEGQIVGYVGDTDATSAHLHMEVRLGTRCTARYSYENPSSSCARDYDPAVHPFHLVPGTEVGGMEVEILSDGEPFVVEVRTPETDLDLNRIETDLGTVDYDFREGIDARTETTLDDFDYGWMVLVPDTRSSDSDWQAYTLTFPSRPAYIEVLDWRGDGWRIEP